MVVCATVIPAMSSIPLSLHITLKSMNAAHRYPHEQAVYYKVCFQWCFLLRLVFSSTLPRFSLLSNAACEYISIGTMKVGFYFTKTILRGPGVEKIWQHYSMKGEYYYIV